MSLDGFLLNGSMDYNGNPVEPWEDLGIEVVLLLTNTTGPEYVANFRKEYGLNHIYITADEYSMMPPDATATPVMQLVNPRTMEIVRRSEGVKWDFRAEVVTLAQKNLAASE